MNQKEVMFKIQEDAIKFYEKKIKLIAKQKHMTEKELYKAAHDYQFGTDESFEILGLFDSLRALKDS